jgi:hypothetical protein
VVSDDEATQEIHQLIENSSLGSEAARRLRSRTNLTDNTRAYFERQAAKFMASEVTETESMDSRVPAHQAPVDSVVDTTRDVVELRFPPMPEHVRTARLIAAAVALRTGLDEVRMDEFLLAVGEAVARAVRRCELSACTFPIVLTIDISGPTLVANVTDAAPSTESNDAPIIGAGFTVVELSVQVPSSLQESGRPIPR